MLPTLKQARIDSGKTLQQVSQDLKIRKLYLIALEEGNFDILPGEVYLKGYLKLYSEYLNVNLSDLDQNIENDQRLKAGVLALASQELTLDDYKQKRYLVIISILMLLLITIIYPIVTVKI